MIAFWISYCIFCYILVFVLMKKTDCFDLRKCNSTPGEAGFLFLISPILPMVSLILGIGWSLNRLSRLLGRLILK